MFCKVLTDCPTADATEVTWLVNSQSVESSYLDGRALQGGRRCAFQKQEWAFNKNAPPNSITVQPDRVSS